MKVISNYRSLGSSEINNILEQALSSKETEAHTKIYSNKQIMQKTLNVLFTFHCSKSKDTKLSFR